MSYELSVSEVGAAEYPLMEVLRETIFGEFGHVFRSTLTADLEGRTDVLALIAHLEGNPIGYKVGYRFGPGIYYSKSGGVLKEYRRLGLAGQMHRWQHAWVRARGYKQIFFNTFPKFPAMIEMGLNSGFVLTGMDMQCEGECSFRFTKDLMLPDPVADQKPQPGNVALRDIQPQDYGMISAMASLSGDEVSDNQLETELSSEHVRAALTMVDNKPVGFYSGRRTESGAFRTSRFDVIGPARGRGAEAAMLDHQRKAASELRSTSVEFEVHNRAVHSIRAAVRAGYQLVGMRYDRQQNQTMVTLVVSS